ncbi:MAG: hypothetical protein RJA07_372 [Bacteroidota bacterium]|jgi:hypothetical protein
MENMTENFIPKLNAFTELLKEVNQQQINHAKELSNWLKDLKIECDLMKKQLELQVVLNPDIANTPQFQALNNEYINHCKEFEKHIAAFRVIFQNSIDDTNFQLGMLGTHWGGYIEQIGVQFMLNTLRSEHGVHTSFQKFKRYWNKSRNVEIDLLALSDTTAYVVEVKNQLKDTSFMQMLKILDKLKEKVPECANLKIQPVFVCVHAEEQIIRAGVMANIWIVRYKGFDRTYPMDSFEWLRKDDV